MFFFVDALLKSANGKLQRNSLTDLLAIPIHSDLNNSGAQQSSNEILPPLLRMVEEVFKLPNIMPYVSFFALGGNSLLGTQLIARINEYFDTALNVSMLYEHPILNDVANLIMQFKSSPESIRLPVLTTLSVRPNRFELSSAQAQIWLINHVPGAQSLYQMILGYRLKGFLSVDALQKSIALLVQRQEQLRLRIQVIDGKPYQYLSKEHNALTIIQLDPMMHQSTDLQLQETIDAIIKTGFHVNGGDALFQPYLIQITNQDNVLLLHMHHIISDGWSNQLLQKELSCYYNAYCQNTDINTSPLPICYIDYVYWLREWQTETWLKQEASSWKDYLEDAPPLLALPTDYPRPKEMCYEGAVEYFELSETIVHALNQFSARQQMSLYMVMLTVFKVLLTHYTGEQKIVVGTVAANRQVSQLESIIGFFANTLVIATDLPSSKCWQDAFDSVKKSTLYVFQHTQFPFEALVKEINPERQLNYHPIFQIMFNLINVPQHELTLSGLTTTEQANHYIKEEPFDLNLSLYPKNNGITGQFHYNKKLFKPETIQRWTEHYKNLLSLAINNLTLSIGATDFLLPDEKDLLLHQWTATEVDYPCDETTLGQFEKVAAKNPNDVALIYGNQEMTYAELNAKATRVGKMLVQHGVQSGDLVAICIERSFAMVIGLLGIWKSGAGYVPLDRDAPAVRLEHILQETQCNIILSDAQSVKTVAAISSSAKIVQIDDESIFLGSETASLPQVKSEEIAYVLYTSGSTGTPKGVMVEHRGLWDYLWAAGHEANFQAHSRVLLLATYSFDSSLFQLYLPLVSNATVVLLEEGKQYDLHYLVDFIDKKNIHIINSVPSFLRLLDDVFKTKQCAQLHSIYAVGEALLWSDVQRLHASTGATIYNRYGPTESVGIVSQGYCAPTDSLVTLGRPIPNTRLYILNTQLQPVPLGCYGELYIATAHLAKGYLCHDELTAERFIPNLFASEKDHLSGRYLRLYKSGDKVRWLPDGRLQFAGRVDFQVKIRGHRVELGEIEMIMAAHPAIQSITVIKYSEQLIAFVVLNRLIEVKALRLYALEHLPSFMLPAHWVILTELPKTRTGKVDRKALLSLINQRQFINDNANLFIKPQTSIEQWLATQWATLLKVEPIGLMDHFFMLGGHSLLAIELITKINRHFNITFEVYQLFKSPQLKQLAEEITLLLNKKSVLFSFKLPKIALNWQSQRHHDKRISIIRSQLSALTSDWHGVKHHPDSLIWGHNTSGNNPPLFWCLQGAQELYQLAHYLGPDQPTYGMRSLHMTNIRYKSKNIKYLAEYYANEIIRIDPNGCYFIGGNCQGSYIALQVAKILLAKGKRVLLLILLEHQRPSFYPQKIMLLYGRESHMNPYYQNKHSDLTLKLKKLYPAGYTLNLVQGAHGQFFTEPNIIDFISQLKTKIVTAQQE